MKSLGSGLLLAFAFVPLAANAFAESPREQLQQLVEQVQKAPADDSLREKIIKLAAAVKPAPAVPEEAERRMVRGSAAFKSATSAAGYQDAAKEFEQAALAAPWYGDAYYNLGVAQDKAGNYAAAVRSLKLALLASPESKETKVLLYEVEYRSEKATAEEGKAQAERRDREVKATWAKDLVRWMTENYGRSLRKVQSCFYCTEEDAKGSNWTYADAILPPDYTKLTKDWSRLGIKLSFRIGAETDEIIFSAVRNNNIVATDLCGRVSGSGAESIDWKQCNSEQKGWNGTAATVRFTTSDGKPAVEVKSNCQPDGHCSHAILMLD